MKKYLKQTSHNSNQKGMAAIIVTLIMMVVISMIVLGLAGASRVEQRQSLDQQLSTQAFYAAESGVDDTRKVLETNLANGDPLINKDDCNQNNPGGTYPTGVQYLDADKTVAYTCLKVNVTPSDAQYSGVGEDSIVLPIKTAQPITSIQVSWQPSTAPSGTPSVCPTGTASVFSPSPSWNCGYGVLRADVAAVGGALTRAGLQNNTLTGFFVPQRSAAAGTLSFSGNANKANVLPANCDTASYGSCRMTITGLGGSEYSLRLSSVYRNSNMKITVFSGATPLAVTGAQASIDVTGRSQDVLRRIQVRVPLSVGAPGQAPSYAIQTNNGICKRFEVNSSYFNNMPGSIIAPNDVANPMCVPLSSGTPPPPQCAYDAHDIILTVDTTGSLDETWRHDKAIKAVQRSLNYFVQHVNVAPNANHVSLIGFSENENYIYTSMSSSPSQLTSIINSLYPDNSTIYIEGLGLTEDELLRGGKLRAGVDKAIIFESDGEPDDDKSAIYREMDYIKSTGTRIYVIGIDGQSYTSKKVKALDVNILKHFVNNGGYYSQAESEEDLNDILRQITNELYCQ